MPMYFLPDAFADPAALLVIVGGARGPAGSVPAVLEDHALRGEANGARLALVAAQNGRAQGVLVTLAAAEAARLAFAMSAFGATPKAVTLAGQAIEAFVAKDADAPPRELTPPDWTTERRAHLLEVLAEVMAHFGARRCSEMPGVLPGIGYRALARARGGRTATPARLRADRVADDVETVALARPYAQFFGIEEHTLRHRRFDGTMSPVVRRAVFASGDAVTVLPFDPRRGRVALIEQFRAGALARHDPNPWCLEAVAGRCDAYETPEDTARREAMEEAGLALGRLERIASYYASPGLSAEYITAFVGEADLDAAAGVHGLAEEDEDIRVHVVPLERARALVAEGEVNNAPLLISLQWLAQNGARIAAAWTSG